MTVDIGLVRPRDQGSASIAGLILAAAGPAALSLVSRAQMMLNGFEVRDVAAVGAKRAAER